MSTADAASALVATARHLAARGLSPGGSGNLSVLVGDVLLVTPTGSSLSRVRATDLAAVRLDGEVLAGPRPSKEVGLHRAAYLARSGTAAVVHLHSPAAVAASCLEPPGPPATGPLPALTPYQVMRLGDLPVAPFAPPGSAELAARVAALAVDHPALLLANHGSVTLAGDLASAADLAEELEAAAQLVLTLAATGLLHRRLTAEQVADLHRG